MANKPIVIDASALAAMLFAEDEAPMVLPQIAGCALLAPVLILTEIASIAVKKVRRLGMAPADVATAVAGLADWQLTLVEIAPDKAFATAMQTGLSAYDASYFALARQSETRLVTLDAALARAFAQK